MSKLPNNSEWGPEAVQPIENMPDFFECAQLVSKNLKQMEEWLLKSKEEGTMFTNEGDLEALAAAMANLKEAQISFNVMHDAVYPKDENADTDAKKGFPVKLGLNMFKSIMDDYLGD